MPRSMDPRNLGERLESAEDLDRLADPLHQLVTEAMPRGPVKDALHGVWLGHPLHPLLTDVAIGFWTSAFVLDIVGGRRSRRAADTLVALGVASALPTAAAGIADWSELNKPERRTGVVHAVANLTATALYGLSLLARIRGRRTRGVLLGFAGATAATAGGFLGGHLVFRRSAGVNQTSTAPAGTDWAEIHAEGALTNEKPTLAHLDGAPLAAATTDAGPVALFARCSHQGGPLHEGDLADGCVRCPWHGSVFRMADGTVLHGPATATQPAYELRQTGPRTEARRRPMP
jgi:nitrite reductase/ring-hydroxylating ferredoxin subunit/uncharacterized membrane protein